MLLLNQQVSLATSSTKLSELKNILANDEHFGSKAPVRRQRIFYLGRELKSGGRSLCNLGLGKFNNRILHLYIRPATDGEDETTEDENNKDGNGAALEEDSTAVGARKRNRAGSPSTQQYTSRQRNTSSSTTEMNDNINEDRIYVGNDNGSSTSRPVASTSNHSMANNLAIDLVDSSDEGEVDDDDDDEVEIIEFN